MPVLLCCRRQLISLLHTYRNSPPRHTSGPFWDDQALPSFESSRSWYLSTGCTIYCDQQADLFCTSFSKYYFPQERQLHDAIIVFFFFFQPLPLACGFAAADTILLQPVLSWTSSFVVLMALVCRLTLSIHLCFVLPRFLLPGGTISRVCLPT